MDNNFDHLRRFIETVRSIGLWQRIFSWQRTKQDLVDAANDFHARLSGLLSEFNISKENARGLSNQLTTLSIEQAVLKEKLSQLQLELGETKKINIQLQKEEDYRRQEHSGAISSLNKIETKLQVERDQEVEEKNQKEIARIRGLRETWSKHEDKTKAAVKSISQKHGIQYVDQVPFPGQPDNSIRISNEFIVFDAKSPGSDEVKNFPGYLKDQAEKAKKYAKQENVKSDIFFVVPSNTLEQLECFVYRHGDHDVYIISVDALEPVMLSLKKIEEYEFADKLPPGDRENVCRIIGRFAHLSKRRIQVDSFFAKQSIELAYKCETDLPQEFLQSVMEYERAEKLNPPVEKRVKSIPIRELEQETQQINRDAGGRGIITEDRDMSARFNDLPLYTDTPKSS